MTSGGSGDDGGKTGEGKLGEARTAEAKASETKTGETKTGEARTSETHGGGEGSAGATGGKPARPDWPEDPLLHPASDAGWDSAARPVRGRSFPAYTPAASTPSAGSARPASSSSAAPAPAGDEPVLPASFHENDLRAAVGASPLPEPAAAAKPRKQPAPAIDPRPDRPLPDRPPPDRPRPDRPPAPRHDDDDDDDLPGRPRNRKAIVVAAFSITTGLAIAGLVFLGRANSDRYVLACEAERAVPQEGRAFPPWGTHGLVGEQWRPLKIAPETRCQPHETDDPLVLERLYLAMILDQATPLLTGHEVTKLDEAEALLKQALLLTRPAESEPDKLAAERTEQHKEVERLLGDVAYWRASAKLHDAATALADAAKQFDSAAARHPVHVSDAAAWAGYARKLADEAQAGPAGTTQAPAPPAPTAASAAATAANPGPAVANPAAPPGIALPVEPSKGSAEEPPATATPPPDAGVPTGGVLL